MALPDYRTIEAGTPIIWGDAGAAGVTHTLTFTALADTKARMGTVADLGAAWEQEHSVQLIVETGTAPTAGECAYVYFGSADAATRYPGGLTGSDAAYNDGSEAEWLAQLGLPVAYLIATADADTEQRANPVIWVPPARYVIPVFWNELGQAIRDTDPDTANLSRIILVPRHNKIQDAA